MTRRSALIAPWLGSGLMMALKRSAAAPSAAKPKRINKAIELLESGQPMYYTMGTGGYNEGRKMAQTWADTIIYDMEHGPFDITALGEFIRGLVDGGPAKSGHRTPAVIPQLPVGGWDEATMQANYWMIHQVLDMGAHGIHLCHAGDPGAIRVMVRSARYPFNRIGVNPEAPEGRRGSGGQDRAAHVWGIPTAEYLRKADVWPLNPQGEILLGIKVEDKYALANTEKSTAVPGIGFAEWGPGDMGMSMGHPGAREPYPLDMQRARARVLAASKANHLFFLNAINVDNVEDMIREGVMIGAGDEAAAEKGRRFTKRTMPW